MAQLIKLAGWSGKLYGHVIFVHGLGGHAYNTWTYGKQSDKFWPLWLAREVVGLSAWTLSYAAPPTNWLGNAMPLQDRAVEVLEQMISEPELSNGPIIFICHSLGGLIVKQVLREANDQKHQRQEVNSFVSRVKGVVFIATPHTGSIHANLLDRIRFLVWPSSAVQSLIKNDPNLRNLNNWYRNWIDQSPRGERIPNLIFYETIGTLAGTIVDPGSADAGLPGATPIPIDADHISICKPSDKKSLIYSRIRDFITKQLFLDNIHDSIDHTIEMLRLPSVSTARQKIYGSAALRIVVLILFALFLFMGFKATIWPSDPLNKATAQEIVQAFSTKKRELTPEQIESFIESLKAARGDPSFKQAVEQAKKGKVEIAKGIWRQIYEDRGNQKNKMSAEQAEAARYLAAAAITESAKIGLSWYQKATYLDPQNLAGWIGLGDAAILASTLDESKQAFLKCITLAEEAGDEKNACLCYSRLAKVFEREGNLSSARKSLENSLAIAKRLANIDHTNIDRLHDLLMVYLNLGHLYFVEGDLPKAHTIYESCIPISKHLADKNPTNAIYQHDLSINYNNFAKVLMAEGDLPAARETYKKAIEIFVNLNDDTYSNDKYKLSLLYGNLGDVLMAESNLPAARRAYGAAYSICKRIANDDPTNSEYQRQMISMINNLGAIAFRENDLINSQKVLEENYIISKRMADEDINNIDRLRSLIIICSNLGDVYMAKGDLSAAHKAMEESFAIAKRLADANPDKIVLQRDLSVVYQNLGDIFMAESNFSAAHSAYENSYNIRKRLVDITPENIEFQRDLSLIYNSLGNVLMAEGDSTGARKAYEESLSIAKRYIKDCPENSSCRHNMAVIYKNLGNSLMKIGDHPAARKAYENAKQFELE